MDARTLAGKTLFFILICLFVTVYAAVFGQENSLVGVVIVVLALMMLSQDLSARPAWNLGGLVVMTLAMGLGAFASVQCGNAFVGAVINFMLVFVFSFATTRDLRSPMHFPFLLGYAFMLSVPVSAEGLPVRLLALVLGAVFIVALNVLVNRNRHKRTCHNGIASVCTEVASCCRILAEGGAPSADRLDSLCLGIRTSIYDRLRGRFFTSPGDRTVLDVVAALQTAGRVVCERERDPGTLSDLASLMDLVSRHEGGKAGAGEVSAFVSAFVSSHPEADSSLLASVTAMAEELSDLESGPVDDIRQTRVGKMNVLAREALRTDSVQFMFAVRMSLLFTLWAFIWQYWGLENAKWLLFTTVALVVPYVDGALRKSAMRLTGTIAGVLVFAVVAFGAGGDVGLLSVALVVANYIYTVLDVKRYDMTMVFITFSALIAASMSVPADDVIAERVLFIVLGVVAATAVNYLVLPYRISDETLALGRRYIGLSDRMVSAVAASLGGSRDQEEEAALTLTASSVSSKMHMNAMAEPDPAVGRFLSYQDGMMAQCAMLCRSAESLTAEGRSAAMSMMDGRCPRSDSRLSDADRTFLTGLVGVMETSKNSRRAFLDMDLGA